MKKTIVIGASPNPARFSYKAVQQLCDHNIEVYPLGIRQGSINGHPIQHQKRNIPDVHTVTMYLSPGKQPEYYDYILKLRPRRIIFNPGAENPELKELARQNDIQVVEACTLVILQTQQF